MFYGFDRLKEMKEQRLESIERIDDVVVVKFENGEVFRIFDYQKPESATRRIMPKVGGKDPSGQPFIGLLMTSISVYHSDFRVSVCLYFGESVSVTNSHDITFSVNALTPGIHDPFFRIACVGKERELSSLAAGFDWCGEQEEETDDPRGDEDPRDDGVAKVFEAMLDEIEDDQRRLDYAEDADDLVTILAHTLDRQTTIVEKLRDLVASNKAKASATSAEGNPRAYDTILDR